MKRKLLAIALVCAMVLSLAACGGSGSSTSGGSEGGSSSSAGGLRLVNGKIEVDAQLKALAAAYEEESGVHVEIESMGGGIDIQGQLKDRKSVV